MTDLARPAALARVLVVEDDKVQGSTLKAVLGAQGDAIETAADALHVAGDNGEHRKHCTAVGSASGWEPYDKQAQPLPRENAI